MIPSPPASQVNPSDPKTNSSVHDTGGAISHRELGNIDELEQNKEFHSVGGLGFGDAKVTLPTTKLKAKHNQQDLTTDDALGGAGSRSGSSHFLSSSSELDDELQLSHSSEHLAKYLALYHRSLSTKSSGNSDVADESKIRSVADATADNNSSDALNQSKPFRTGDEVREMLSATNFGIKQSRVHPIGSEEDEADNFKLRRTKIRDFYDHLPNDASDVSWRTSVTVNTDLGVRSESSDDFLPPVHQQHLTDVTPFISKTDLRDQVIAKRLRTLDPTHIKLEKVRDDGELGTNQFDMKDGQNLPSLPKVNTPTGDAILCNVSKRTDEQDIGNQDPKLSKDRGIRNQVSKRLHDDDDDDIQDKQYLSSARTSSSNTDSFLPLSSRDTPSVISIESTRSIRIGYWKVKPTESNLHISVQKAYNAPPL